MYAPLYILAFVPFFHRLFNSINKGYRKVVMVGFSLEYQRPASNMFLFENLYINTENKNLWITGM